uniref:Uncharacterized protein n=1 Tax=Heterorhabditis bacteriophora TaxID=37862 RepID=A0A1I7WFJ4_HETBA
MSTYVRPFNIKEHNMRELSVFNTIIFVSFSRFLTVFPLINCTFLNKLSIGLLRLCFIRFRS